MIVLSPENRFIFDDEEILFQGYIPSHVDRPITISVSNNGSNVGEPLFLDEYIFQITIPLSVSENNVVVTLVDGNGESTEYASYFIRLVTDRSQSDLDELTRILSAKLEGWLPEEHAEFILARSKGAYGTSDLNRVIGAMDYLYQKLRMMGYGYGYTKQKEGWVKEEYFRRSDSELYLKNLSSLKRSIDSSLVQESIPNDLEGLTLEEANAIEKILVLIDEILPDMIKSFWYSGEIWCGEV